MKVPLALGRAARTRRWTRRSRYTHGGGLVPDRLGEGGLVTLGRAVVAEVDGLRADRGGGLLDDVAFQRAFGGTARDEVDGQAEGMGLVTFTVSVMESAAALHWRRQPLPWPGLPGRQR